MNTAPTPPDIGRRCSTCGVTWPDEALYTRCPECEEATSRCSNVRPLPAAEATSRLAHAEFERYYAKRGERDAEIPYYAPLSRN